MLADQAAGLRRRGAQQPLACVLCFFDSANATEQFAHALRRLGQVCLLVDVCGRLFAASPARNLFDWKQQIERGQLHTQPFAYGEAWYAPGVRADEPALRRAAQGYDQVVFDLGSSPVDLTLMPDALHAVVIEIQPTHESMLRAYTLLKTLSHANGVLSNVGLLGDPVACDQVQAACSHFLEPAFTQTLINAACEDDAIVSLAVRMVGEGTGPLARYIK
jgi:hypothetical protein